LGVLVALFFSVRKVGFQCFVGGIEVLLVLRKIVKRVGIRNPLEGACTIATSISTTREKIKESVSRALYAGRE
jgi:hypothetical protein